MYSAVGAGRTARMVRVEAHGVVIQAPIRALALLRGAGVRRGRDGLRLHARVLREAHLEEHAEERVQDAIWSE